MMPGRMSGKVTFQKVVHSFAPRSIAASSRWRREARQPGLHGDDHEADVEHDVGDDDGQDAQRVDHALRDERQLRRRDEGRQQRGAEDDLRRRHRQEDEQVGAAPAAEVVAHQRERDERPEDGRDERREERDDEAVADRLRQARAARAGPARHRCENPPHCRLDRPAGSLKLNAIMTSDRQDQVQGHAERRRSAGASGRRRRCDAGVPERDRLRGRSRRPSRPSDAAPRVPSTGHRAKTPIRIAAIRMNDSADAVG